MRLILSLFLFILSLNSFAALDLEDIFFKKTYIQKDSKCDVVEFERFLDDNIEACKLKENESLNKEDDPCYGAGYELMRSFMERMDLNTKLGFCMDAIKFCESNSKEFRFRLYTVVSGSCLKKVNLFVNQDECKQYSFSK